MGGRSQCHGRGSDKGEFKVFLRVPEGIPWLSSG